MKVADLIQALTDLNTEVTAISTALDNAVLPSTVSDAVKTLQDSTNALATKVGV